MSVCVQIGLFISSRKEVKYVLISLCRYVFIYMYVGVSALLWAWE